MNLKLTTIATCSAVFAGSAFAHHSLAPYDIRNPVDITGSVVEFRYIRPHPMLTLMDDQNVEWVIEVPVRFWERAGIAQDAIQAGDELVVLAFPARDGDPEAVMGGFEKDGTYYAVHENVGQQSANAAADAIEAGESLESVLERYADEE